jgi:hypothetical protein
MKADGGPMRAQWRAQAGWIDAALVGGGPFLAGEAAGLADIAAYMNIWFMMSFAPHVGEALVADFEAMAPWRQRVKAIGHGRRSEMTPAEALQIAGAAEPAVEIAHDPADPSGLAPGAMVTVAADDYGRDPIAGALVAANRERVVIERQDGALGRLRVHFPRAGYVVAPAT